MEPLTFKILTDADDSGVKKYEKSLGGLNTTSQKTNAALRSFGRELLEAKSGTDVAAAGANALSQALQKSLAATAIIGGVKILSDGIKRMAEIVKSAGDTTRNALVEVEKLGETTSFDEATKKAQLFQSALTENEKKLGEIKSGNWFVKLQADITGVTKELEAQNATLQRNINAEIAYGLEVEKQRKLRLLGLSEEEKAREKIDQERDKRLKDAQKITDPALRAAAEETAIDISRIDMAKLGQEETKRRNLDENRKIIEDQKIKDFQRKDEMDEFQRGLDQKSEKTKEESANFYKRLEDKKRLDKEAVDLQEKQLSAQDRVNAAREKLVQAEGDVAQIVATGKGSGRGIGQRKSSLEIGIEKSMERGAAMTQKAMIAVEREKIKAELRSRNKPSDAYAVDREVARRAEASARQAAQAPFSTAEQARDDLASAESYLANIETLLTTTLEELKTYAHAGK